MNTYYICDKDIFEANTNLFHYKLGAHYMDLPSGQIILSAHFPPDHSSQDTWESLPSVQAFPDVILDNSQALSADQQVAFTDIVAAQPVSNGSKPIVDAPVLAPPTVLDLAAQVAALNPLMKLTRF